MAIAYKISKLEIAARPGGDAEERSNFRVLVSNDPYFNTYEVAGECSEDYGELWSTPFSARERYQYVRVEKTSDGELSIGEINVYVKSSSILYGTEQEEGNTQIPVISDENKYNVPEDVLGTDIETEVRFLSALSIMQGYEDGNFLPDEFITRAEFAAVASRLVQQVYHNSENTFSDVPQDHWAYDAIEACYDYGMINGVSDGIFAPNDYVTYDQAVKIIVCALGYGKAAKSYGEYPDGYIRMAQSLRILDDVERDGDNITRGNIAKMCYLALFARLLNPEYEDSDTVETLLSRVYRLSWTRGQVTEIDGLSLENESVNAQDEQYIVVNDIRMTTDDPNYRDRFGCMVDAYYRELPDGTCEAAVIIPLGKESIMEIEAEDVAEFDNSYVLTYYDENQRLRDISFTDTLDVIYNSKPLLNYDPDTLIPEFGTIRAIDYDDDGRYDIMVIKAVKTYVVNWVNADEEIIYLKNSDENYISFDSGDDLTIYNIEGEEISLSDILAWNVLSVEESMNASGSRVVNIYVSDVFARGEVSRVDDEYVTIRNKEYKAAETLDIKSITAGDTGVFYLDYYGRIAAFDGEKSRYGEYGFVTNVYLEEGDDLATVRIFTSDGEIIKFIASEDMKIDDAPCYGADAIKSALLLGDGTNGQIQQLVRYSSNSKNEIMNIDTVYTNTQYEIADESLSRDFESASRYYKSNSGVFGMVLSLSDDAVIFRIPENPKDENEYEILSRSAFSGNTSYAFEAYDCDALNTAKVAVVSAAAGDSSLDTEYFFVVDRIDEGMNSEGDVVKLLNGLYKGKYVTYAESEPDILSQTDLKQGDIVCVSLTPDDEIKRVEKRFYDGTKPDDAPTNSISIDNPMGPTTHDPYWNLFMIYGSIESREGSTVKIKADTSQGQVLSQPKYEDIIVNVDAANLYKYIYDTEEEVRVATSADFIDAETLGGAAPRMVVCRINSGDVLDIVIYK